MKKILYIIAITAALSAASCTQDADVDATKGSSSQAVQFSAEAISATTKVSGTSWEDGDAIGITATSTDSSVEIFNAKYTTKGGTPADFTPAAADQTLYFSESRKAITFDAYYPYQESWSEESQIFDIAVQNSSELTEADFMRSETLEDQTEGEQSLKFSHAFSLLNFNIETYVGRNDSTVASLKDMTITLSGVMTQYDLIEEEYTESGSITMHITLDDDNQGATATAILLPTLTEATVTVSVDGQTLETALDIDSMQEGKQHSYNITLGEPEINISLTSIGIENWENNNLTATELFPESDGVYTVANELDLMIFYSCLSEGNTFSDSTVQLTADVSAEDITWLLHSDNHEPFAGTFDGGGYTISDLTIVYEYSALLPNIAETGVVKNLTMGTGGSAKSNVAAIAYENSGTIQNCHNSGFVISGDGYSSASIASINNANATIINCSNRVDIEGTSSTAGLVASNAGEIINCYNMGTVTNSYNYAGGIAAINSGVIRNCYSATEIASSGTSGSIAGNNTGEIISCYFNKSLCDDSSSAIGYTTEQMQEAEFKYILNNYIALNSYSDDSYLWTLDSTGDNYPSFDSGRVNKDLTANDLFDISESGCELGTAHSLSRFFTYYSKYDQQANALLTEDIDMGGSEDNISWGSSTTTAFKGTFDGDNHTIENFYCSQPLFSAIDGATIKNLGIEGGTTSTYSIFAASASGSCLLDNCYNNSYVNSDSSEYGTAGFVAMAGEGCDLTFINCYNAADITNRSSSASAGAFLGGVSSDSGTSVNLINCYNTGTLTANSAALLGDTSLAASIYIDNCYNAAELIVASSAAVSPVVAEQSSSNSSYTVENCYYIDFGYSEVCEEYSLAMTEAQQLESSFAALLNNGVVEYNDSSNGYTACAWSASDSTPVLDSTATASTTAFDTYLFGDLYCIYTKAGLYDFAELVNDGDYYLKARLRNNIDLESEAWTPIPATGDLAKGTGDSNANYRGSFNGDGYSITGLSVTNSSEDSSDYGNGLFSYIYSGEIKNLTVGGSVSSTGQHTGVIVGGANLSTISNCSTTADSSVTGDNDCTAGIVGYIRATNIDNCTNNATISGASYTGGITGYVSPYDAGVSITYCTNNGSITASGNYGGGVAGRLASDSSTISHTITYCSNYGVVKAGYRAGGITGAVSYGTISYSSNSGSVSTTSSTYAAGIVAYNTSSYIDACANYGSIYSAGNFAGGIVAKQVGTSTGDMPTVINCGNVNASITSNGQYVGGLVGANASGKVYNSFSYNGISASVYGSSCVGGLVGINEENSSNGIDGELYNCYVYTYITGQSSAAHQIYIWATDTDGYAGVLVGKNDSSSISYCYRQSSSSTYLVSVGYDNNNTDDSYTYSTSYPQVYESLREQVSSIDGALTWYWANSTSFAAKVGIATIN